MRRIGTDFIYGAEHLPPEQVSKLTIGQVFAPNDVISTWPTKAYGNASGACVHIEEAKIKKSPLLNVFVYSDIHGNEQSYDKFSGFKVLNMNEVFSSDVFETNNTDKVTHSWKGLKTPGGLNYE